MQELSSEVHLPVFSPKPFYFTHPDCSTAQSRKELAEAFSDVLFEVLFPNQGGNLYTCRSTNSALPDQAHSREGLFAGLVLQCLVQHYGKRSLLKWQHVFVPKNAKGREAEQLSASMM